MRGRERELLQRGEAVVERTGDAWAMAVKLDGGVVVEYESWEYEGRRRKIQRRRALDGVTIGFAGGEIVGIEGGPNGSGKSTLLRTMCGIHVPISGEVLVYGKGLTSLTQTSRGAWAMSVPVGHLRLPSIASSTVWTSTSDNG